MGYDDGVADDAGEPFVGAHREIGVAFTARRAPVKRIEAAFRNALGVGARQVGRQLPFPMAVVQFAHAFIEDVVVRGQAHRPPHDFHCLARPTEWAAEEVVVAQIRKVGFQDLAVALSLRATPVVQRNVALTLVASGGIPVRLAMADDIKRKTFAHQTFSTSLPLLPPV